MTQQLPLGRYCVKDTACMEMKRINVWFVVCIFHDDNSVE